MNALAAIHIAKKQLGMDDDTYRDFLMRETGKESAKLLNPNEARRVMAAFERAGFTKKSPAPVPSPQVGGARRPQQRAPQGEKRLTGPFAAKIQALWIALWNLGEVQDRRDSALEAFVKRQTGLDKAAWLHRHGDAQKVIEGLKGWLARAGVDWTDDRRMDAFTQADGYRIAVAQWRKVRDKAAFSQFSGLGQFIIQNTDGEETLETMSKAGWIEVMNVLGRIIREAAPSSGAARHQGEPSPALRAPRGAKEGGGGNAED